MDLAARDAKLEADALWLCPTCRARPTDPGRKSCTKCREDLREREMHRIREHDALGLCVCCDMPALSGRRKCAAHLQYYDAASRLQRSRDREAYNASMMDRYYARRAQKRCTCCGAPAYGSMCTRCLDRRATRKRERRGREKG